MLIQNAKIISPQAVYGRGWLRWEGSRLIALGAGAPPPSLVDSLDDSDLIDANGLTLLPGFIDIHVHGAMGSEAMDATPQALHTMARFYAQHGVTGFLATTWTDSQARITAALENIAAAPRLYPDGASLLGAHLEGPYLNPVKCGAQSTVYIRRADPTEARAWLDLGLIRLLALAPEYPENHWLISECVGRGITVSAAHTNATYAEFMAAAALGLNHSTHTFNAMTGLHHRDPGALGAAMTLKNLRCELIADLIHVHPAAMQALYLAKGASGIILITDAIRGAGMPEGDYPIDERIITVADGAARLPDGTLAGSILTMDQALTNFMGAVGEPLEKIWPTSSLNAARAIGLADRKGSLEIGKDADLVLIDETKQGLKVQLTIAQGRIVYRA